MKKSAAAGHQPSHAGHLTTAASPSRLRRSPGRSQARASAAKGLSARVQSPITPQEIGTATQTNSQKKVGTMFSATACDPTQPARINPAVNAIAIAQRTGAGRRSWVRSTYDDSPAAAGATARGRTSRNEAKTTRAPPKTKSQSGTGRS